MRRNKRSLRLEMCEIGWPNKRGSKPIPLACAECESMCGGGVELLQTISVEDFRALLCGGDCETCRQPCNLRRIAAARGIKPEAVKIQKDKPVAAKAQKPAAKKRKTPVVEAWWIEIALKPYYERMKKNAGIS